MLGNVAESFFFVFATKLPSTEKIASEKKDEKLCTKKTNSLERAEQRDSGRLRQTAPATQPELEAARAVLLAARRTGGYACIGAA